MTACQKLVVVCGPTGAGKTDLAFNLANKMNAKIISFDSIQVFREVRIGSAQPPKEMLASVKHYLIDQISPKEVFTAGDFRNAAEKIIKKELASSQYVILVGGTGFYIQALLKGMYESEPADEKLKLYLNEKLKNNGLTSLYEELLSVDADYAKSISPNDTYRVLRALEVWFTSGKKLTDVQNEFKVRPSEYTYVQIGIAKEKSQLINDLNLRTDLMLKNGLVDETQSLLSRYGPGIKVLQSVGYKETCEFLKSGKGSLNELHESILKSTLKLAKRQMTWFKRDKPFWIQAEGSEGSDLERALFHIDRS